jgi:hypothetical protein
MFIHSQEVIGFIRAALECSVYVAPLEPGLSYDEIVAVGKGGGYQEGELNDAIRQAGLRSFGNGRFKPDVQYLHWEIFGFDEEPEYRDFRAFDVIYDEFNRLIKSLGGAQAKLERRVLVERAIAKGIRPNDIEAAITISLLTEQLVEKNGVLVRPHGGVYEPLPSQQAQKARSGRMRKPKREQAYPLVRDVVDRRSDGRPAHAEPLDAFGEALTHLDYGQFRLWWKQSLVELDRSDAASFPTSICVLAAALVEGALTFVVRHAQSKGLAVMGSKTFQEDPRRWKIDDLVESAAKGGESAILNTATRARAESLIRLRQRIHAGRMLSEHPSGAPDLRPEEAREARQSAEIVVRAVLDWLDRYPASSPQAS